MCQRFVMCQWFVISQSFVRCQSFVKCQWCQPFVSCQSFGICQSFVMCKRFVMCQRFVIGQSLVRCQPWLLVVVVRVEWILTNIKQKRRSLQIRCEGCAVALFQFILRFVHIVVASRGDNTRPCVIVLLMYLLSIAIVPTAVRLLLLLLLLSFLLWYSHVYVSCSPTWTTAASVDA